MEGLSFHVLDVVDNAIAAEVKRIARHREDPNLLTIQITDNGPFLSSGRARRSPEERQKKLPAFPARRCGQLAYHRVHLPTGQMQPKHNPKQTLKQSLDKAKFDLLLITSYYFMRNHQFMSGNRNRPCRLPFLPRRASRAGTADAGSGPERRGPALFSGVPRPPSYRPHRLITPEGTS